MSCTSGVISTITIRLVSIAGKLGAEKTNMSPVALPQKLHGAPLPTEVIPCHTYTILFRE